MSLSQADDIRDFQIEGISIGDSVLDHSKIKNFQKFIPYKSKKYQGGFKKINSDIYDSLQFFYIKKDKNKTLENISGKKYFPNNIPKRELLIVVNIISPPGRHKLEISDRNILLSYTCSITSEAITKSNLFRAFSPLTSKSSLVVIHL